MSLGCPSFGTSVPPDASAWRVSALCPQVLVQGFTRALLLDDAGSVLAAATSWEELEIQEEAESGHSVTSKIRLPVQVSCGQGRLCPLARTRPVPPRRKREVLFVRAGLWHHLQLSGPLSPPAC